MSSSGVGIGKRGIGSDEDNGYLRLRYSQAKGSEPGKGWTIKYARCLMSAAEPDTRKFYLCCSSITPGGKGELIVFRSFTYEDLMSGKDTCLKLREVASHLLPFDPSFALKLRRETGRLLYSVYSVVHNSRIIFSGRSKQMFSFEPYNSLEMKNVSDLPHNSHCPLMVSLGGKFFALSFRSLGIDENESSLHVLDSDNHKWLQLPQPPHFGATNGCLGPLICPAVVGTKLLLFVQNGEERFSKPVERRVFCFDPASGWRQLPAPSFRFHLPESLFTQTKALVVHVDNMKVMFLFDHKNWRIGVHTLNDDIMSDTLSDDIEKKELVKTIGYFRLPLVGELAEFAPPCHGEFIHLGGNKVCFIGTQVPSPRDNRLLAIPFRFSINIVKKTLKLEFMPPRISEPYPRKDFEIGSFLM